MANADKEEFMHDWYAILSCDSTSTKELIEKAARKLAVKYHPDKTSDPEAPEKFLLVQKAKEILLDDTKRKVIDDHREGVAKRQAYETQKNQTMDARRKRMRDEFNDRLNKASTQAYKPTEAEVFESELKKRSKIIADLRNKNNNLMEQTRDEAINKQSQQAKDFINYRKSVVESASGNSCQLKVKWKRSAESHSDDSLYQLFKVFGTVEEAVLVGSKGTSGLVTFTDAASAVKAFDFYKNSEDYRVSLLSDSLGGNGAAAGVAFEASKAQQSELSSDIKRAVEKNNLLNIIGKLRRPQSEPNLQENASHNESSTPGMGIQPNASSGNLSETKTTGTNGLTHSSSAANLASKESDVLQKMMEAARKKKLAQAQAAAAGETTKTDPSPGISSL